MPICRLLNGDLFSIDAATFSDLRSKLYSSLPDNKLIDDLVFIDADTGLKKEYTDELDTNEEKVYLVSIIPKCFLHWVNKKKLHWGAMSMRACAIHAIKRYPSKVHWQSLCLNPHPEAQQIISNKYDTLSANSQLLYHFGLSRMCTNPAMVPFFKKHPQLVKWRHMIFENSNEELLDILPEEWYHQLCNSSMWKNPNAIETLLERHAGKSFSHICENPHPVALQLMAEYPEKICWTSICMNTNPDIIPFIEQLYKNGDVSKRQLDRLSSNPNAIRFLMDNKEAIDIRFLCKNPHPDAISYLKELSPDKIYWDAVCSNSSPEAMEWVQQYPEKINWDILSANPSAIDILENNPDKVNYRFLSENPAIFVDCGDTSIPSPDLYIINPSISLFMG